MRKTFSSLEDLKKQKYDLNPDKVSMKDIEWVYEPNVINEAAEAYEYTYKQLMKKKVKMDLQDKLLNTKAPELQKLHTEIVERKKLLKPWILVTLNCKEGTWKEIWKNIGHLKTWIWLRKALITVEQRGDTEDAAGKLVHFHLLLQDFDKEPGKIRTQFYEKWKHCFGNPKHVDVTKVKHEWKQDKIAYLTGGKVDSEKLAKQDIDKIFRKKFRLEEHYSLDSLPTSESKPYTGVRKGAGRKPGPGRPRKPDSHCDIKKEIVEVVF